MQDLISRQAAIEALDCINGVEEVLRSLPSAQPEPCEDAVSIQAMFDTITEYRALLCEIFGDENELVRVVDIVKHMLIALPSSQPEDCDTCKHGYFGDERCGRCRVRYSSHYERRIDD